MPCHGQLSQLVTSWSAADACVQVPSEIHTNQTRTAGMCGTVFVNFIASFIIGQCFNQMMCSMEYGVFLFFAGWVLIMTTWVALCLPETKGIAVENVMDAWATCAFPPSRTIEHIYPCACIHSFTPADTPA